MQKRRSAAAFAHRFWRCLQLQRMARAQNPDCGPQLHDPSSGIECSTSSIQKYIPVNPNWLVDLIQYCELCPGVGSKSRLRLHALP